MRMKKWILFLAFALSIQIGYKITPILAQENQDIRDIKRVIESFLKDVVYQDIDSAMLWVSISYSDIRNNNIIDYSKFKSELKQLITALSKKYINGSISDLEIIKLDIKDQKAHIEIGYGWKGFNLDTLEEDSGKVRRIATLVKENGSWKITQWMRPQQTQ